MRAIFWITLLAIIFFSLTTYSWAVDYKHWLAYLPDTLGGLSASTEPEGQNLGLSDGQTVMLTRTYGEGEQQVELTIHYQGTRQEIPVQDQPESFSMESPEGYMKVFRLQGFNTVHTYEKASEDCRMHIHLRGKAVVTLSGKTRDAGRDFVKMASQLPLAKLSALMQ